jgi:hypothetical protein
MKQVHIGFHSYTNSEIVEEVANVLGRDTLLVCEDGEIIDDSDEIAEWEEKNCY